MRKLFASFWRKNLGFFRLAIVSNLEYRFNYFSDAIIQPTASALIEVTLWFAIFRSAGKETIAGFSLEYYLAYALWVSFISRITVNWMYEFRMSDDIENGGVNSILVRPVSFYEYYFSQFLGYKLVTTLVSLPIPLLASLYFKLPIDYSRLPLAFALVLFYLLLAHTISFCVSSTAFFYNRVQSFTVTKNFFIWLISGELFPLDLFPSPWKEWIIALPFSSAVYLPAGYITSRFSSSQMTTGFVSVSIGIIFFMIVAKILWSRGLHRYSGTGA